MPAENILVIAVDGLRASALGAYGNTTFATPALDALASESLLFDWWFADAAELPLVYRACWRSQPPLPRSLAEQGYTTTLVTDEPRLKEFEAAGEFHRVVDVPPAPAAKNDDIMQSAFARLFAAVCGELNAAGDGRPRFVWVHARGMYGPWDAPLAWQEPLLEREEGDPPPENTVEPPDLVLDGDADPDAAFRWSCAYAAQVMLLDACLGSFREVLDELAAREPWLVVFAGVRGFPLGEHGRVGGVDARLHAEQLHVPMLCHFPDGSHSLARSGQLASHAELAPLVIGRACGEICLPSRDALIAAGPEGIRAIRTSDWTLRLVPRDPEVGPAADPDRAQCALYVRPDDRWEANDVAALCPDVVDELLARLAATPAC